MIISIPCSFGELIDKITILEIKQKRLHQEEDLQRVGLELHQLIVTLNEQLPSLDSTDWLDPLRTQLFAINSRLWDLEETVRWHEQQQSFGLDFIESARAIYAGNDQRAQLKRELNMRSGSTLVEVKSHRNRSQSEK